MERFRQKQMKLDEMTEPGCGDAADYIGERDKKSSTSKLKVPAVITPQTDDDAAAPAPTTLGEHMEYLDVIPGILQMLQVTPRPGGSDNRWGSVKPRWNTGKVGPVPAKEPNWSPIQNRQRVEPISFYICI